MAPTILTAMMNVEGGPANRADPLSVGIQVKMNVGEEVEWGCGVWHSNS